MSNENSAIRKRLKDMAQLTVLANRMSEIQEKNLKMYPFVFFNGVESVRIDFNLSKVDDDGKMNHEDHYVAFHLEIKEGSLNENMDKRFYCLVEATRVLFWNDLKVRVFINDKLEYENLKNVGQPTS